MKKYQTKAFTLVELIIVITILAILATIGFMSFQTYTRDSRDTKRKTDLTIIRSGLEIYQMGNQILPTPDEKLLTTLDASGNVVTYQGYAGTTIQKAVKMTNDAKDPKDNTYYTYSTNGAKTKYQLLALLENNPIALNTKNIENNLIKETYAQIDYTTRFPYTVGQKVGIFFTGTTNQPYQESLATQTGTLALSGITTQMRVMFSNAPATSSGYVDATGSSLPAIVVTETQSVATSQTSATYSCTGTLITANATITNTSGLTLNTAYQNTNRANSCYYTCKDSTYTGTNCENREVFGDEDTEAIGACNKWVETAIGTNAGGYANWVWVPASKFTTDGYGTGLTDTFYKRTITYNGTNYTCKGFAVMKYEAKFANTTGKYQPDLTRKTWSRTSSTGTTSTSDTFGENLSANNIISKRTDYPIARLTQGEAIDACSGLTYNGKTSHLITNNEWMGITRNIEQQTTNWTNGIVGSGGIYRGNVNLTDNMSYSSFGSTGIYTQAAGNDTDTRGTNAIGNRRLILSNNSNIWDISGNVWEHVNKSNLPTTNNLRVTNTWNSSTNRLSDACSGVNAWASFYGNDGVAACTYTNSYTYTNIG
ncbi:MAG: type II secretion system protein, partial [Candidatus Gracilibacteria bacterium]|nr:type II secretion system protein [Candidatus Gracilibacteria bacterium]